MIKGSKVFIGVLFAGAKIGVTTDQTTRFQAA